MTGKICDIRKYSIITGDRLFFDANIWIYLWSPPNSPDASLSSAIMEYSRIYSEMISQNIKILTSWLVLSEFVNFLSRKSFQSYLKLNQGAFKDSEFKSYRDSIYFLTERKDITTYVKKILEKSQIIPHDSSNLRCDNVLNWFENNIDLNDAIYVEDSIITHYKIVTHDKDFKKFRGVANPDILTANPKLFKT